MKLIRSIIVHVANVLCMAAAGYGIYEYGFDLDPSRKSFVKYLILTVALVVLLLLIIMDEIIFSVKAHRARNYKARHLALSLVTSTIVVVACVLILFVLTDAWQYLDEFNNFVILFPLVFAILKIILVCFIYRDGKALHVTVKKPTPVMMKAAPTATVKPAAKPVVKKQPTVKKATVKKPIAKKPVAKKATKKPVAKKASVKKVAAKKAPTKKKPVAKKTPAKKKGKKK
ncbi:MAG: hypothetical protein MJ206_00205 [Bacilli bacterium]|nr:hypothetical protein [Bacilli bacterium]